MIRFIILITVLLAGEFVFGQTELRFTYDAAGNQTNRVLCTQGGDCEDPEAHLKIAKKIVVTDTESKRTEPNRVDPDIRIYPNPTSGEVHLSWESSLIDSIQSIYLTNSAGTIFLDVPFSNADTKLHFDVSPYPNGLYIFKFFFSDRKTTVSKKIIKH